MATYLTRDEVREVDRHAIEDLGIPGVALMENAGRAVTEAVQDLLSEMGARPGETGRGISDRQESCVAIVCGRGNNGGDGYVVARHLANADVEAIIYLLCDPADLKGDAATNFKIIRRMGVPVVLVHGPSDLIPAGRADVIVDAIFGTGLRGAVRPPYDALIGFINELRRPVVAVDIPSGLDCDSGAPLGAAVNATRTVTFVALKKGFENPASEAYTGEVTVASIGAPVRSGETGKG